MKKIVALGLAVAGAIWAFNKTQADKPADVWAEATDKI